MPLPLSDISRKTLREDIYVQTRISQILKSMQGWQVQSVNHVCVVAWVKLAASRTCMSLNA